MARWKNSDLVLLQIRADVPNLFGAKDFAGDKVHQDETVNVVGVQLGLDKTVSKFVLSSTTRIFKAPYGSSEFGTLSKSSA